LLDGDAFTRCVYALFKLMFVHAAVSFSGILVDLIAATGCQRGLWILSDVKKVHHRRDKPEYGRTPQHQTFWQSMPNKEPNT